jgi:hypothetical protein
MIQNLRGARKCFVTGDTTDSDISPAKALRTPSSEKFSICFLCALSVFAGSIPGFGCGFAAL